ncbi:MAG: YfcE family phosphodiesterase [Desulfobacteraceae bacterium]|nr:YfcE family phosphodiesterase [Desulfobacteraceae bacterium]
MNIAVMSDSHDHIWNLRKALAVIRAENCGRIIHCGDFVAPFMFKELEKAGIPVHCVFGNNDGDKALLTQFALQSNGLITLDSLVGEMDMDGFKIAFTHEWIVAEGLAAAGKHHLVCFGHSHQYLEKQIGDTLVLNPGDIMGKDDAPGFCIMDTVTRHIRQLPFHNYSKSLITLMETLHFKAPWTASVKTATVLGCTVLLGLMGAGLFGIPGGDPVFRPVRDLPMIVFPPCILFGSMLFMIRGYELTKNAVYVKRLLWRTTIYLPGLTSVEINPAAMSKSFRTFGNGGLFSICGAFSNRSLGNYRAYATDPEKSVVLRFKNHVVVVTPHDPERFVSDIHQLNLIQLKEAMK